MRSNCEVVCEVDITRCVYNDIPIYISTNQVILSPGLGDKGIIPAHYLRAVFDLKTMEIMHETPIKYGLIFDLECNCAKDKSAIAFNEIVEFPIVLVDLQEKKIVGEFQTYVKPTLESKLNPFCTELTGITDEQVLGEGVPDILGALEQSHEWLEKQGVFKEEFVIMSCGDFDCR